MKRLAPRTVLLALLVSLSLVSGTAHANSTVGAWSPGPVWDIAPINMLMLPTGKVMFYPGNTISGDDPRLWDPATNQMTSLARAGYDIFCTGHSFLRDGTILFTGGNLLTPYNGLPDASVYNPFTNIWTRLPDMNAARWYPSTTTLANGDVLVMTGTIDSTQMENPLPQIWQPGSGTWRNLTNAMLKIFTYSWVYATPNGKAFVAGPEPITRYLDTAGTGSWSTVDTFNYPSYRDYGSSVMYGPHNILIAGGGQPPTNTAEIIDLSAPTPTWQYTNPMAFARRHMNMTLLPDDNVLVTGGTSADGFNDTSQPVLAAEMWNIATRTWTTMASQTMGRFYHSNSLLLPDGRVLSAGGDGIFQAEIYSPPYLFKGARPTITSAPSSASYAETFFVGTPDATSITKVRLIRLPAVTHAFDMNQRLIVASFSQASGGLNVTAPSAANFAPPGHYMLFILNGNGVPSVAKIIKIDETPTAPAAPSGLGATAASSSTINLTWADQANNEDGFRIERKTGAGSFTEIGTVGTNVTTYADSGLAASTSYSYQVRAYNTVANSGYSNTASATTFAPSPIPAAPTGLVATAMTSSGITLTWIDQSNNEASFKIERALGAGTFSEVATVGTNVTTYADNSLATNTAYSYRVRASNIGGDSAFTNTANATTFDGNVNVSTATLDSGFSYIVNQGWGTPGDTSAAPTQSILRIFENGIELGPAHSAHSEIRTIGQGRFSHWGTNLYFSASNNTNPRTNGRAYAYRIGFPTPPAAPSGLAATATSSTAINLTWVDQSTTETGFKIERALGAGAFSQVGLVGTNVTTYADSGLAVNTAYTYRVRATNTGGDSAYSSSASTTTWPTAPTAPSGLVATATSSTAITLTWVDQSNNETSFKIERAPAEGAFVQVATVGANVATYADSGLTTNSTYTYRVRASNTGGDSAYSNTATATTSPALSAPSGLAATATSSTAIDLTWVDQSTNETSFKIERALGAGAFSQVATVGANVTTFGDSGLTPGTSYSYRVRASNTSGDSAYSNTASATTLQTSPAAPSGLAATAASSTAIDLTWVDQSTNETSFKIERALGAGAFSEVATVGANVTTYADSGLTASTAYTYRVRASNTAGNSGYSNTAGATTFAPGAIPAAPTGLVATAMTNSAVTLTWVDQSTNETGFKIERAFGAGAFSEVGTVGANVTTYSNSGLATNTTYSYRVRASNTGGDSASSNTGIATTFDGIVTVSTATPDSGFSYVVSQNFGTPGDTSAAPTQSILRIFENGTELGPAHSLHSQIRTVGQGRFSHWGNSLYFSASNNTDPRTNGKTYAYRIGFPTIPAAPSGLGATTEFSTMMTLTWTDQSTNETSFKIERALGAGSFGQVGLVGANVTNFTDTGLSAATTYSYRVRASNTGGDSAYSNTATASTLPTPPAAPSGLGATAASSSAINLSWTDGATNEDGFKIERKSGAGAFVQIGTVGPNITTYADSGLTASTAYSYQVRAYNTGGDSAYSNTASATTLTAPPPIPGPPSGLGATAASSSTIDLSWTDGATDEDGFKIERKTGAGAFVQIGTVGPNITTYADSGLTANTAYSYQVRAYNTGGDSAYSNTSSATTLTAPPPIPGPPSGLGATAASSSAINLSWTDGATNEDGFKIERKSGAGAFVQIGTVGPNITTYADSGLTASTAYSYQVRAHNTGGDSAYSNTASATTLTAPPPIPGPPSGLGATAASSSTIDLSWTDGATNEDGFKIERKTGAGAFVQIGTVGPNITTYADSGLTASTAYSYQVRAYNTGGDSAYSNTASATTLTAPPPIPGPPSGLGATAASSSAINLSWTDAATNEDGFKIERKTGAGAFVQIGTVGPNITTYADSGLTASTAYSYQVRAHNTGGDSAYSNTSSATTFPPAPAAPSGLGATAASSSTIDLSWTDAATNEDGFKIERKTGAGAFVQIGTVGPNITTYADSGLTASTAYSYQVRAHNTGGDSPYSNTSSATTFPPAPAAPSGLGATAALSTGIDLTWVDQSTNETNFKIERALGASTFSEVATVGANVTTYADSGLTAGTSYSYRVRASNTGGDSAYSNTATASTLPTPPTAPSGLGATAASSSAINLSWTDGATDEDGFKIERKTGAGAFVQIGTVGPNITTYADSGLTASTAYSYQVRAHNTGGDSAYSNTASATTLTAPPPIPGPPSGLGATAASSSALNLSWTDGATNEDGFKIERKTGAGAFVQIGTVGPNITTYADSGLTANTAYSYQVRAYNTGGDSAYSNTASATTFPPAPAAPSALGATAASSSAINLSWTDGATDEDGFKIERKTGAGAFVQIGTVGPNITTYADSGLTASTAYSYQVRAHNTGGDSAYSNTASATTLTAPPPIPGPPSGLGATAASSSTINLSWTDGATDEDGFKIERKTGAGAFVQIGTVGPNITTYADSGLTANTAYSYQVRAHNTGGDSAYSNTSSATTFPPAPTAPSGLGATAALSTGIDLTWVDQSTNETNFKIERALGASTFSEVATVGANVTTYADSGLTAGTSYSYRVRASNTGGDSAYSNTATASTLPTPPTAPSGLGATAASSSAINLSWTDGATDEDGFKIERKTGAGAFVQIGTVGPNITTYADSGLTASTAYSYQVRAHNTGGDSAYSNTASATTLTAPPPIPGPPSGLGATAASSSAINLSWTDGATDEDGFKIERKTGAGAFVQIGTVGPNITTYADSGLTASTAYSYQVRAHNTGGDSPYSNTSSATTFPPAPAAPSGLGATAALSTGIDLTWVDQSTNETNFKIERALGASTFSEVATVGANVTTYADSGLTAGTSYSYRVRASNTGGDSAYSNTATASTLPTPPTAPSALGATAASSSAINLSWTDGATNEDGFKIERKTGAGAFVQIGTVGPNITTYADSGLTANTAYSYQVRAHNTGGDSAYSNTASATTLPPAPAAPSGLGATAASSSTIDLSWTDAATNEDGFKIERKTGAGAFVQIGTVGPNITTYADSGLTANTAYSYQVRAHNTGGDSAYSNTSSATTLTAPPPIPGPPSGLGATAASSSAINLSWTDGATNEDGFKIERKSGAGAFVQIGTVGPNITTYADSGLTASTAYSYQVRAHNTGGDSAYSNTASATTLTAPPPIPGPPSGLGATAASSSTIDLSWTDGATNEDGFKIERKTEAGAFVQIGTVGPNITTYADSGLTASTAYSYQVRAYNTGGDSAYSNTASATTLTAPPPIPGPPSGLGATAASSSAINLSWTDAATNEDGFKIERKTGAGAFVQIGTVGPNITTYADSGLTASTAYSYQVRAHNTGGDSAYSNTSSATTFPPAPAAPSGLGATAASSSTIDLSWTDAATNEDGFKIERKTGAGAFVQIGTVGPNITTYADSGLTASTAYSYQVRAHNTGGDSAYSNTASATTLTAPPPIPGPPSGLGATAASSSAINLSWTDGATDEDGFKIERKTGAGAFVQIGTVGANVTTYADSGLTASTAYSYQVRAYNTGGDSAYSNTSSATTFPPAPAAPSGLGATAASSSAINLSWTDGATDEDGFKIERKTGAGAFVQIGTVGPNITTYADSGLTAGTSYSYRVRASNTGGDSAYSNTATASTLPTPPTAPSGLGATAASSSAINLSWTDGATDEDGFKIERKTGAGAFVQIGTVGPNITTYADSGLTASTAYSYQVRAYNTGGDSAYSNTSSATTLTAPPPIPGPPSGLGATAASSSAINLSWTDGATNEDGFKIERKTGAGAFVQIGTVGPNITTYADSGLTANTAYSYQVRAYNTGGDSAYSNTASATTLPPAPAAPTGLGATAASSSAINLSWTDGATDEDGFKIERKTGAGAFVQIGTVGPNITTYADSGLTASTAYSYQVRAHNTGGDSAYSNTSSATTFPPAPTAPSGLGATAASSTAINLTWVDQSTNETGFKIERALGAGAFSQIATVGPNITIYGDSGLTASTSYSYRVRATNTGGDSTYSNTSGATTLPPVPSAPTGLGATATSSSAINLTWTDQSTNETGFKIERALGAGAFSQIATVGSNITTYGDSGLTASTSYSYRVRATNTGGDSTYSNTASATTQATATAPAAPTGLVATAATASTSAISLTWGDQSTNETSFRIERRLGAGAFSQVATVGANVTTYADSGLAANTAYSYRVRASNTVGDSAYSNTSTATTSGLINVTTATLDSGFAYTLRQDFGTPADTSPQPTRSVLRIFENGIELGPPHSKHSNIRNLGAGRFSHWAGSNGQLNPSQLIFSASNNTNPRTNGRTYTFRIGTTP